MKAAIISVSMTCDSYHETEIFQLTAWEVGSLPALDAQTARYTGKPRARGERIYGFYWTPATPLYALPDCTRVGYSAAKQRYVTYARNQGD